MANSDTVNGLTRPSGATGANGAIGTVNNAHPEIHKKQRKKNIII